MRRTSALPVVVCGLVLISVGAVQAAVADDDRTSTVEVLPVPAGEPVDVDDLTVDHVAAGQRPVAEAVQTLTSRYPELEGMTAGEVTPAYDEDSSTPIGVSVQLDLPAAVDVTMELIHTLVDERTGELRQQPQLSKITDLRGLSMHLSLETGQILALNPMPYPEDVHRPDRATVVEVIDD